MIGAGLGASVLGRTRSVRVRLLVLVLVPLVLLAATVILLAARWTSETTYRQLFAKVTTDLSVAQDAFERLQSDALAELAVFAANGALQDAIAANEFVRRDDLLATMRTLGEFDRLRLLAPHALGSPSTGQARVGVERIERTDWQGDIDAATVLIPLVDTPRAAPDARAIDGAVEDRALLVRAWQPVLTADGRRVGWLEGGQLLNRDLAFVDVIRDLVYGPGSLAPGSRGTVTLFLDDVRVSTNVPDGERRRALGTRVSKEVRDHVLGRGLRWTARAFVVNDWYVSGYEPIVDPFGERIGMLYAGFSDAPFRADARRAVAVLSALSIAGCLLAAMAAVLGARAIFAPVERMAAVARATAAGEHRRIGRLDAADELSELAHQFDAMLDALESQRGRIESDARQLEHKVAERTEALQERNLRLQESLDLLRETRAQLATAERLAALGELTAGVAHEINNPTAVILGNLDLLVDEIGSARDGVRVEIDLIVEQVYRIRSITDRLLAWSRRDVSAPPLDAPGSASPATTTRSVADLVAGALALIQHELPGRRVVVQERHDDRARVRIDEQELHQVLVNLLTNALEAGDGAPAGGMASVPLSNERRIVVSSRVDGATVRIEVADNGPGIAREHLARVFDPFFTVNKVGGTGLGLSVSHGIVDRAGGRIEVDSAPGEGARFTVVLPRAGRAGDGSPDPIP